MRKLLAALAITIFGLGVAPAQANEARKSVVLINTFTVPVEQIDATIAMWEIARDFLKTRPGYISTKLHRSLSPEAKYLLINVAQWESPEAYKAATVLMRKEANLPKIEGVVPGPGLYEVIRD
jgi:heme oxygenase (mycobilin-producing)